MPLTNGPITIKRGERLCQPMSDIVAVTSALSYSVIAVASGSVPERNPHLGFFLPCVQFPCRFTLPIYGPIEGILKGETVTDMTIQFLDHHQDKEVGGADLEIGNVLSNVIGAIFASYYERQAEWLESNVSGDKAQWPMILQFSRVIRNAVVHLGVIDLRNPKSRPVTWRNLTYSYPDNGRQIHPQDLNTGDFIALMIEIDEEMNNLNAPAL